MPLNIIKNESKKLTKGEKELLNKIKLLYKNYQDEAYLYVQPTISKLVPDFILIDENRGISILEVKDWSLSYIKDINLQNISVSTFHKMAMRQCGQKLPYKLSADEKHKWFDETLPQIALQKCKPYYDVIMIDEYQDFRDDWIKVCINLCKKYEYKNYMGKEVEDINLFMTGDRLQSIYNAKEHSWNKLGINM